MYSSYSAYLVKGVAGLSQAEGSAGHRSLEFRPSQAYALRAASATLELRSARRGCTGCATAGGSSTR